MDVSPADPSAPSRLAQFLIPDESVDSALQRVAELAVEEVDGCDMAGVTLVRGGHPETAVFTDAVAPDIDEAQYESGSGPCLDAFLYGQVFRIKDTASEWRWPAFTAAASEAGVQSTLSLPLVIGETALGALNLYSRSIDGFDDERRALLFAAQSAVVLANSQAYWASHHLASQLEIAMESRAPIEQAKGVLMGIHRCDADTAFSILRQMSNETNRKLREVADDVITSVQPDEGGTRTVESG